MANDGLERFEAVLGAISKITSDTSDTADLVGARCPKCHASSFARVSDLYPEAVGRLEEQPESANVVRVGGLTDLQLVKKLSPPRRKSALGIVLAVAVPLAAVAYFLYRRFGDNAGELAAVGGLVITTIVFLTTLRRQSDAYYHGRRRWNSLYVCRQCGQLVAP